MIEAVTCYTLSEIEEKALEFDIIGIDEGQFFEEIVEFSEKMANLGKTVIIAALDGTFERKPFGKILELIPLSENVTKLDAVWVDCNQLASFTKRTCDSKETELIGGSEIYKPVCRGWFIKSQSSSLTSSPEKINLIKENEENTEFNVWIDTINEDLLKSMTFKGQSSAKVLHVANYKDH